MKMLTLTEQIGYLDFPQILKKFHVGHITKADLLNPEASFMFNCVESHILRDDNRLPSEVTHLNMKLPMLGINGGLAAVRKDQCEAAALRSFYRFLKIVIEKQRQGKVQFNVRGNYS